MHNQNSLISVDELLARSGGGDVRIIDCRFDLFAPAAGQAAFLEAHIPGAVYADLERDLSAPVGAMTGRHPLPSVDTCGATFRRMGINADTFVVVYDEQNGAVAARAWWMLRWLGHARVALLDGGLAAWRACNLPLATGHAAAGPGRFVAQARNDWIIGSDEILPAIATGLPLLDARATKRFAGLQEPIDSVAGHIPGATSLPFERSLGAAGRWQSRDVLRQLWAEVLEGQQESPWGVMCGSGVTACHLVLSAKLAGLTEPKLYVGSWSEWIRDPSRPVAVDPV